MIETVAMAVLVVGALLSIAVFEDFRRRCPPSTDALTLLIPGVALTLANMTVAFVIAVWIASFAATT